MLINELRHTGLPPRTGSSLFAPLCRVAGSPLARALGHLMVGILVVGAVLSLSVGSEPHEEQTQQRFDQDSTRFRTAMQAQLALSRHQEPNTQSPHHKQDLLRWLNQERDLLLRVRVYEENRDFPMQLMFDSTSQIAAPSGPIWMHGISHRVDVGGRTLVAVLSPSAQSGMQAGSGFTAIARLLMVMVLGLALTFVLPQLAASIIKVFTTASPARPPER